MDSYTNVTFDGHEAGVLKQLAANLRVRFPGMHEAPTSKDPRVAKGANPDLRARAALSGAKSYEATHEQLTDALWAAGELQVLLVRQSDPIWWLNEHEHDTGMRPAATGEPTGPYEQYVTLAGIRMVQLRETEAAIELLEAALLIATPRPSRHEIENA